MVLQSESSSGMCAKLHTVAASNNRDHPTRSLYYCLFAPHMYGIVLRAHSVRGEPPIQRNASGEFATMSLPTTVSLLTRWFRNVSATFVARAALLIWISLQGFFKINVSWTISWSFLLLSSTQKKLLKPSIVICCGESWANLGPRHFLSILREIHAGMSSRIVQGGELSKNFGVNTGVKQGCVLQPVIFNLFVVAVNLVFRHGIAAAGGILIKCRLDGNLFNTRRLQAVANVTNSTIFDQQYADNAALPSDMLDGLQRELDVISSAYGRAGLVVNSKNVEVLHLPSDPSPPPTFFISGNQLDLTEQLTYLGSIVTSTCDPTAEIQSRVDLESAFFGRLSKRVFTNRNLSTRNKTAFTKPSAFQHCSMSERDLN